MSGIFVFFVYVFSTSGSKNDLSKMLLRGSKRVHKKRKNQMLGIFVFFVYPYPTSDSKQPDKGVLSYAGEACRRNVPALEKDDNS